MATNQVSKFTLQLGDEAAEDFELIDNNNALVEVTDTVTENTTNKTEQHTFKETTTDGTENQISDFLIASNQITDITENGNGDGVTITQTNQTGSQTSKNIALSQIGTNKNNITAANTAIQKNASDITEANAAIQKNATNIQKNTEDIAKISTDPLTIYPIGSIYMSVNSASPATLFGGTWTQIKDVFLMASGDTYTAGTTGGTATHSHEYSVASYRYYGASVGTDANGVMVKDYNTDTYAECASESSTSVDINSGLQTTRNSQSVAQLVSKGQTENVSNLPPYIAVYMWQRTA